MTEPTAEDSRDSSLLTQIEREIIDRNAPLGDILLKCAIWGSSRRSGSFRDWIRRELNGYESVEVSPAYRAAVGTLWVTHVDRNDHKAIPHQVPPSYFPSALKVSNRTRLTESVSELEALAAQEKTLLVKPTDFDTLPDLMTSLGWMIQPNGVPPKIGEVYIEISPIAIRGVLGRIRGTLAVFVSELRASLPEGQETPSVEATNEALAIAIPEFRVENSPGAIVNFTHGNAGAISTTAPSPPEPKKDRFWPTVGWGVATLIALVSMYAGLGQWLGWPAPWK
ncbi:hypothetical protein ACIBG7_12765 [Nonomuraea sp. NPDC050328]|uniref:AbiTii domain-containing protein n=1 Tax=Nonomuraea sp. NPDC050328 TaxID=3364361 RepID=UPI003799A66A